jgi:tetratricopeptide (TPR) repeat protein
VPKSKNRRKKPHGNPPGSSGKQPKIKGVQLSFAAMIAELKRKGLTVSGPSMPNFGPVSARPSLIGNPDRRADDSGRGMIYQYWKTADVLLDIQPGEQVFVEGAEDIDRVSTRGATASSVRDTKGSGGISLGNAKIIKSLNDFYAIRQKNPNIPLRFQYLTTSGTRAEQGFDGRHAVRVWMECHIADPNVAVQDAEKIRDFLLSRSDLSKELKDFLLPLTPLAVLQQFILPISWITDQPELSELKKRVCERIHQPRAHDISLETATIMALKLYDMIGDVAVQKVATSISYQDVHKAFEDSGYQLVSRDRVNALIDQATGKSLGPQSDVQFAKFIYEPPPLPEGLFIRKSLTDTIQSMLTAGAVAIYGPSGAGKTLLTLQALEPRPSIIWGELRQKTGSDLVRSIYEVAEIAAQTDRPIIVLDDLNDKELVAATPFLAKLRKRAASQNGCLVLIGYLPLPSKICTSIDLKQKNQVEVTDFSEKDIKELLLQRGCQVERASDTSKVIWYQTYGRPQLVDARVNAIRDLGFPRPDAGDLFDTPLDVQAERAAARKTMQSSLPPNARALLERLSVFVSTFSREAALRAAEISPPINQAGEALDALIGPWVERTANGKLSVSPMAKDLAKDSLPGAVIAKIHHDFAGFLLEAKVLDTAIFTSSVLHAINGDNEEVLLHLSRIYLTAPNHVQSALADSASWMSSLGTSEGTRKPTESPHILGLFRLMQWKIATLARPDLLETLEAIIDQERLPPGMPPEAYGTRIIFLTTRLLNLDMPMPAASAVASVVEIKDLLDSIEDAHPGAQIFVDTAPLNPAIDRTRLQDLFAVAAASRTLSPSELEGLINELDSLPETTRNTFLEAFQSDDGELRLVMRNPHIANERGGATAAQYERSLRLAIERGKNWGNAHWMRAAMRTLAELLEDQGRSTEAKDIIAEAISTYGRSNAIAELQATTAYNAGDFETALAILTEILPHWDATEKFRDLQPMYAERVAAISAAHLEKYDESAEHFRRAIEKSEIFSLTEFSIGLRADLAFSLWRGGRLSESVQTFASVIKELTKLNISVDRPVLFVLYRLVSHVMNWLLNPTDDPKHCPPGLCSDAAGKLQILDMPLLVKDTYWFHLMRLSEISGDVEINTFAARQISTSKIATFRFFALKNLIEHAIAVGDLEQLPDLSVALAEAGTRMIAKKNATPEEIISVPDSPAPIVIPDEHKNATIMPALIFGLLSAARSGDSVENLVQTWLNGSKSSDPYLLSHLSMVESIIAAPDEKLAGLVRSGAGWDCTIASVIALARPKTHPILQFLAHIKLVFGLADFQTMFTKAPTDLNQLMRELWEHNEDEFELVAEEIARPDFGWSTSARIVLAGLQYIEVDLPFKVTELLFKHAMSNP